MCVWGRVWAARCGIQAASSPHRSSVREGRGCRPLGLASLLRKRQGGAREATPSPPRSAPGWSKHAPCGQGQNHALLTSLKKARGCDEGLGLS